MWNRGINGMAGKRKSKHSNGQKEAEIDWLKLERNNRTGTIRDGNLSHSHRQTAIYRILVIPGPTPYRMGGLVVKKNNENAATQSHRIAGICTYVACCHCPTSLFISCTFLEGVSAYYSY